MYMYHLKREDGGNWIVWMRKRIASILLELAKREGEIMSECTTHQFQYGEDDQIYEANFCPYCQLTALQAELEESARLCNQANTQIKAQFGEIKELRTRCEAAEALASQITTDWMPANQKLSKRIEQLAKENVMMNSHGVPPINHAQKLSEARAKARSEAFAECVDILHTTPYRCNAEFEDYVECYEREVINAIKAKGGV
jgi:DNA repair exonuclease SbcCD ATPase subunit